MYLPSKSLKGSLQIDRASRLRAKLERYIDLTVIHHKIEGNTYFIT